MSQNFLNSIQKWDSTYGKLVTWIWRIAFYPVLALTFYAGNSYLSTNYVSKPYFDKAMNMLAEDKQRYSEDNKMALKELLVKMDSMLLRDSASTQRFTDIERRLSRIEDAVDRLKK